MKIAFQYLTLSFFLGIISCNSLDYVYVDNKTFQNQISQLKNGYVEIVLKIDPLKENFTKKYIAPGKIIKEKMFLTRTPTSTELIQLILEIVKNNHKYKGDNWHPTYKIYIKYTYKILYVLPIEKYKSVLFDFENLTIFIDGRAFLFSKNEAEYLQLNLDYLLSTRSSSNKM